MYTKSNLAADNSNHKFPSRNFKVKALTSIKKHALIMCLPSSKHTQ